MSAPHGYSRYTNGCRCDVCREAKSAYIRAARAEAARRRRLVQAGGGRYVVEGITHGLAGWHNKQCRCEVCSEARAAYDRNRKANTA